MQSSTPVFFGSDFEDTDVTDGIEKILIQKRGYAFRMPKKNEPVLLVVSGGLDSTMLWFHLMHTYGLAVYPVYFTSSVTNKNYVPGEIAAVKYFYRYFRKRYPKLAKPIKFIPLDLDFSLVRTKNRNILEHNWRIVASNLRYNKEDGKRSVYLLDYPTRFARYLLSTYEYGLSLQAHAIPADTIFLGVVPDDNTIGREPTLSVLRSLNLYLCLILGDWKWQITGPVEKKRGFYFPKEKSVKIALQNGIPLEHTWSCTRPLPLQCGMCNACRNRHRAFVEAGTVDRTPYLLPYTVKEHLKRTVNTVKLLFFGKRKAMRPSKKSRRSARGARSALSIRTITLAEAVDSYRNGKNLFLKNKKTEELAKLNEIGGEIFTQIQNRKKVPLHRIVDALRKKYPEIKPDRIRNDVRDYLVELETEGFVELK